MRVKFTSPFDYVILRTKQGTPRATVAYTPTDEPITVKREHGEAAVKAGKAVEILDGEPVRRPAKKDARQTFNVSGAEGDKAVYDKMRELIKKGQEQTLGIVAATEKGDPEQ